MTDLTEIAGYGKRHLCSRNDKKSRISLIYSLGILLIIFCDPFTVNAQESIEFVKDHDGNLYKTVKIGTQIWMAENLATTRYNDHSEIPVVTDEKIWAGLTTPACCWYNNDTANKSIYGALYNWHAVNTRKLCPSGWHVPTEDEWKILAESVNGDGGSLKVPGPSLFKDPKYNPNIGASNTSGFTALLGGFRSGNGTFYNNQQAGFWWSATEYDGSGTFPEWNFDDAIAFTLGKRSAGYGIQHNNKLYGLSIRCLKDN